MPAAALDLICCALIKGRLAVLVSDSSPDGRSALPWTSLPTNPDLDAAAARLTRAVLGRASRWTSQVGAFADATKHPSGAALSIAYVAVVPANTTAPAGHGWVRTPATGLLGVRQRTALRTALTTLRDRMDLEPLVFHMLPAQFTLSELQTAYELLLGRRLHKASFRRALAGSELVEARDEWRLEGRGRPAQFYRYHPRRGRRGIRHLPVIKW